MTIFPDDLAVPARLVLAHLREYPDQDDLGAMATGKLSRLLERDAIESALVELRARGLARELSGRWHLTSRGRDLPAQSSGRSARFSLSSERRGTVAVVTVDGTLDESAADQLDGELAAAVDPLPEIVLLDLDAVDGLSAAAVAAIDAADARGRRTGARLVVLCGPGPGPVRTELARAGLAERLTFVESAKLPD